MKWTRKADPTPEVERVSVEGRRRFPKDLWEHEPVGPSFVIENASEGGYAGDAERWVGFDRAVARFAEVALPVWPHWHWHLVDEQRTVVLGYSCTEAAFDQYGPWGWWIGVRSAFDALALIHDPMEVAVWETIAKERAWS